MGSRWSARPRSSRRGCESCPMRFARAGSRQPQRRQSPPRSRLPRRTAAADRQRRGRWSGARSQAGEGSAARGDTRRSRVWRGTAAADRRVSRRHGAEFLITSIEPEGPADPPSSLRTTVRYDIVGGGTKAYRIEHVGEWDMRWRRGASGWQVVRWLPTSHLVSRARRPVFTEITGGGARSHRLVPPPAHHRSRLVDGDVRLGPHA